MPVNSKEKCVMIIAGEASGDHHGAMLVEAMRQKCPNLLFFGIGGQALKNVGVKICIDASELSVVGITEAFSKLPCLFKAVSKAKRLLKTLRPDLLILIDFPDFNLHVAARAKKLSIPVFYYISPQIWAWRSGRVRKIKARVNHMAVILPFEEKFYRHHNVPVTFVGHPLLDTYHPTEETAYTPRLISTVGLLPGSRDREITVHLPVMLDAVRILLGRGRKIKFIISIADTVKRDLIEAILKNYPEAADFEMITDNVNKVFKQSHIVVASSGTVTLEAAISGIPMVIIYKVSPFSYWVGKKLIKVKDIGLVNLIAGKRIVPELLQEQATPLTIANRVDKMLNDPAGLACLRDELLNTRKILGQAGASERAADIAIQML